jgi:transposase
MAQTCEHTKLPRAGEKTSPRTSRSITHWAVYRRRNVIERCVGWLKQARAVATRFEKLAIHYLGTIKLAMIRRHLRLALSNTT